MFLYPYQPKHKISGPLLAKKKFFFGRTRWSCSEESLVSCNHPHELKLLERPFKQKNKNPWNCIEFTRKPPL